MFQGQRIHLFPDVAKSTLLSLCRFMNLKTEFVGKDVKSASLYYPKEIKAPNRGEKIPFSLIDDANRLFDIQFGAHNLSKMIEDSLSTGCLTHHMNKSHWLPLEYIVQEKKDKNSSISPASISPEFLRVTLIKPTM